MTKTKSDDRLVDFLRSAITDGSAGLSDVPALVKRVRGKSLARAVCSSITKLLGHGDLRSVHRYRRGTGMLRVAVEQLEKTNPTKILPEPENEKHLRA